MVFVCFWQTSQSNTRSGLTLYEFISLRFSNYRGSALGPKLRRTLPCFCISWASPFRATLQSLLLLGRHFIAFIPSVVSALFRVSGSAPYGTLSPVSAQFFILSRTTFLEPVTLVKPQDFHSLGLVFSSLFLGNTYGFPFFLMSSAVLFKTSILSAMARAIQKEGPQAALLSHHLFID